MAGIADGGRDQSASLIVIDDEADVRKLLRSHLVGDFAQIYEAADGHSALSLIREHDIPLALVDVGIPGLNGLELLQHVQQEHMDVLCIILTGNTDREVVRQALKLGAYDFLDKPCDSEILRNTVRRARETMLYRREMGEILEFLVCEYGRFAPDEYQSLSLEEKAKMLAMVKGILALKATRRKTSARE